jgi:hypothetical protein
MKKLFVLVSDGGDGSYNPVFTFNEEWVNAQHDRYDNDGWDEGFLGADGDGFHYIVIRKRPELDTVNPPGQIRGGPDTLSHNIEEWKKYEESRNFKAWQDCCKGPYECSSPVRCKYARKCSASV